jgi:hypothetical protein
MWKMYGDNMKGVRIALPSNPFIGRHKPTIYEKGGANQRLDTKIEISRENGGMSLVTTSINGPNKIHYTDNPTFRNSPCFDLNYDQWSVQFHDLGMVKNTYWEFEQEWRYKICATFSGANLGDLDPKNHPALDLIRFPVSESALYVPLDNSSLDGIEILLAPCVTEAQELIVESILSSYASNWQLEKSEIKVRV